MSAKILSIGKNRESVLRMFARLFFLLFILTALLIAALTWKRTLSEVQQQLSHTSQLMAQSMRSHFSTFELVLHSMADELVYRDVFNNPQAGDAFLARAQEADLGLIGYGLISLDGEFIATSGRNLQGSFLNSGNLDEGLGNAWDLVRQQSFHVGKTYYLQVLNEWIIPLRVPVNNERDELRGILSAAIPIDGGNANWANIPRVLNESLLVVRDDGYLIYMHPLPDKATELEALFSYPVSTDFREYLAQGPRFYRSTQNEDKYISVNPVGSHGLNVIATIPRAQFLKSWQANLILPGVLWFIFVLISAIGYRRAQRLLRKADGELREKQEALEYSINQYHELTRLIPIGVYQFLLTRHGTQELTYVSDRLREIINLPVRELPASSLAEHVYSQLHPEDAFSFFKRQEFATKETQEFYWEGRLIQPTGERWIKVHSVPSQDQSKKGRLWNGVVVDITERKSAEQQINLLAYYDALTQLPNRRLLRQRLDKAVKLAQEKKEFSALLFIDVDNFKQLNDSFGHAEGDRMLREIGARLGELVREYDTVARLGGDEFVVLLTRLSNCEDKAASQVEVVIQKVERLLIQPFYAGSQATRVTLSTGITLIDGAESDIDVVLQQADQAMYRAKDAGRNTQCFYDANIQQTITDQLELQQDLKLAIAADQLALFYQAQVNSERKVVGMEALIRWHHPTRGMVMPATFIPLAEQSGDIVSLGEWILKQACQQLVAWANDEERQHWTIAINVSVRQLRATDFAEKVLVILAETGAKADRLVLEITESMLLVDTELVIEKMTRLKRVGVKFSLDDFGTGYSSLGYLNRLPIDELKIDQSFVRDMNSDEHHQVLIRTILSLGQTLSLITVAEGVENEAQFINLKRLGCTQFQGYHFAKPMPVSQL